LFRTDLLGLKKIGLRDARGMEADLAILVLKFLGFDLIICYLIK